MYVSYLIGHLYGEVFQPPMPLNINTPNGRKGVEDLGYTSPQQFPRFRDLVFVQCLTAVLEVLLGMLQMPSNFCRRVRCKRHAVTHSLYPDAAPLRISSGSRASTWEMAR